MRKILYFTLLFHFNNVSSQDLISKNEINYAKAPDWHNHVQSLNLDLFYPPGRKKFPLIVYLHGGGFEEGTSKAYPTPFCKRLAKNGFVVANVECRTGFEHSATDLKTENAKAVYRAVQDQLAAIRYLVHHAAEYFIDTSAIFIAGESAGGVASLFTGYVSQDEWDHAMASLHTTLGAIGSSGNDLKDQFTIKAVINFWGALACCRRPAKTT